MREASTSPTVDAGDPALAVGDEPAPNGGRVNQGAYGGTADAATSPPLAARSGGGGGCALSPAAGVAGRERVGWGTLGLLLAALALRRTAGPGRAAWRTERSGTRSS